MMPGKILTQNVEIVTCKAPVADAFAGTLTPAPINMRDARAITFLAYWGVGATGTSAITVEACDDTVPTNTTAIAFKYRRQADTTADVWGALTNATSAGFATTAGSNQMYAIEVDADQMAATGYKYVRFKAVEVVASARLGGVLAAVQVNKPRAVTSTVLT
jgi:hypothetical protein